MPKPTLPTGPLFDAYKMPSTPEAWQAFDLTLYLRERERLKDNLCAGLTGIALQSLNWPNASSTSEPPTSPPTLPSPMGW